MPGKVTVMSQSSAVPEPQSRYARVKAILAAAAGDTPSDYGGLGPFWELPLNELIDAKIYGVRLIAPAIQTACCDDGESRSTGSGLVRALRGAPPFDGDRFPPFMWGGSRVAPSDVDFIADWIDDGCPADGGGPTPLRMTMREVTRAKVIDAEFDVASPSRGRYAYREGEPRQRANLDCLTEPELDALREAFRAIYDLNKFADDRRSYTRLRQEPEIFLGR
jgi:tyrosinase